MHLGKSIAYTCVALCSAAMLLAQPATKAPTFDELLKINKRHGMAAAAPISKVLSGRVGAAGLNIPGAGSKPGNYDRVSSNHLLIVPQKDIGSLSAIRGTVDWETWIEHYQVKGAATYARSRIDVWMVGSVWSSSGKIDFDLLELGAQHRSPQEPLAIRVIVATGVTVTITATDPQGNTSDVKVQQVGPYMGFYPIAGAGTVSAPGYRYRIQCDDSQCAIEAFYLLHPPGTNQAQEEDGGPPPTNPSNLD